MTEESFYQTALTKSMALCSAREYCTADILSKLNSWGVGNSDSLKIIRILVKENFINETRYASAFVKDKFNYNKWGKVKIAAHLRAKHLSSDIIDRALDSIDNETYLKAAKEMISSHRRHIKAKNQYDLKGKLLRYGLSKGFESSLIYDLLTDPD